MTNKKVLILETVVQKLTSSAKDHLSGVLTTWEDADQTVITACLHMPHCRESFLERLKDLESWLPGGFKINGTFGDKSALRDFGARNLQYHVKVEEDATVRLEANNNNLPFEIVSDDDARKILSSSLLFVVRGTVDVTLVKRRGRFSLPDDDVILRNLSFYVKSKRIILRDNDDTETCKSAFLNVKDKTKDKAASSSHQNVVEVHLVKNASRNAKKFVPAISCIKYDDKVVQFPLHVTALCYVRQDRPLGKVSSALLETLSRQLRNINICMKRDPPDNSGTPLVRYYQLNGWCHPVVICFASDKSDQDLLEYRKTELHPCFMEQLTRPLFRRNNAIDLFPKVSPSSVLTNTHVGLPDPKVVDGKIYLVKGTYGYHHYMQDRMDDNGWGCAYRSLQTLVSWFKRQAYTDKPIPSHKEIQQILVDVGDKPKEFVGTRKWIGSIEVQAVLNQYLGITSKIMFVSQGSELACGRGRELAMHFEKHGTPVMIGGGVLAHTILGVCFSETSGETRFLILDPHYTGSEDLRVIQNKGWCGWKDEGFWNPTAYYNLCLPQAPIEC